LAKKNHPDIVSAGKTLTKHQRFEAEERFRAINEAYSLLMK
jgi:curved DNA-binding protein CbpA